LIDEGDWDGSPILACVYGLALGAYSYTLVVYDTSENLNSDTVLVSVVDTTPPTIDSPADIHYEEGSAGHSILWSPSDNNPHLYEVYRNGSLIDSSDWDGSELSLSVDGLTLGTYNYTLVVYDTSENWSSDTVFVSVVDTTPPTIDSPEDITYEGGTSGHNIAWSASDLYPDKYDLYVNGSLSYSDEWNGSEILVSVDGLTLGIYNYTLVVYDNSGNSNGDTVFVTVLSSTTTTTTTTTTAGTDTATTTTTEPVMDPLLPLVILIASAGAAIVVLLLFVFRLKRKS
jgi:hypothetical protein